MTDADWMLWINRLGTIATFLIFLGVGGELFLDWVKKPIERRIDAARELELTQLRRDASQANAEAARLNKLAEDERLARVKIEERIAPRRLANAQRSALVTALKQSSLKGLIDVVCVLGDGDGFAFATQLDEALKAAGWPTTGVNQAAFGGGANPVGFGIVVHAEASAPTYAAALQGAFKSAGMDIAGAVNPNIPERTVQLLIGNKPQ